MVSGGGENVDDVHHAKNVDGARENISWEIKLEKENARYSKPSLWPAKRLALEDSLHTDYILQRLC